MNMNPKNERIKSHKYRRDGAKYLCTLCKAKYFSKVEVEECYDKCLEKKDSKAS